MAFTVADIEAVVAKLMRRGVRFDPAGIVHVEGNYAVTGASGERGAWFWDSEGNLIGVGQPVP
jgi:hypothetical protein